MSLEFNRMAIESIGYKSHIQQPVHHPENLGCLTKKQSSDIENKKSFWTTNRIAILGAALFGGAGIMYFSLRKTPLPYTSCKGVQLSGDEWGQALGSNLKIAFTKACELAGKNSTQIETTIDKHLKEGPYGYGLIVDQLNYYIGWPYSSSPDYDLFTCSSCLTENSLLKKEVVFEITPYCKKYIGKPNATSDEHIDCDDDYQSYTNQVIESLQRACDPS